MRLIKNSKKVLSILLALSLICALTACSGQDSKTSPSPDESRSSEQPVSASQDESPSSEPPVSASQDESPSSEPPVSVSTDTANFDNSSAEIAVMTQEYTGDNVAEILMINYDGEENTEIESFNNTINFGIQQIYYNFIGSADSDSWIEIRSYPFSSDNYLQIVTTCCTYPNYGTDGDLYSYNFDLMENRFLSIDDILEDLQLDRDSIADTVRGLLEDENNDGATAKDVNVAGFLITQGPSDPLIQLLLQVELEAPGGDPWNSFFGYTPELGEILPLNSECLFDPSDIDQMDPPLSYQTDILPFSFIPEIAIDTSGLEELTQGCEYMFDGMVYYFIEELTPVAYSEDDVLEQIKSLEPSEISLINITNSDEHSELLSFPCWLVVYYEGGNEDTIYCKDIYVQTDTADYRVHTSVSADFKDDYHDEIGNRLATIYWNE